MSCSLIPTGWPLSSSRASSRDRDHDRHGDHLRDRHRAADRDPQHRRRHLDGRRRADREAALRLHPQGSRAAGRGFPDAGHARRPPARPRQVGTRGRLDRPLPLRRRPHRRACGERDRGRARREYSHEPRRRHERVDHDPRRLQGRRVLLPADTARRRGVTGRRWVTDETVFRGVERYGFAVVSPSAFELLTGITP